MSDGPHSSADRSPTSRSSAEPARRRNFETALDQGEAHAAVGAFMSLVPAGVMAAPRPTFGVLLRLQRSMGNQFVTTMLTGSTQVMRAPRKKPPKKKTPSESNADFVKSEVAAGRYKDLSTPAPGGIGSAAPGGAFWLLNGLNPDDMLEVLRLCGKDVRGKLLAHIADADGRFDRPRLESALRSAAWGEQKSGVAGLSLLDATRDAGTGSFAPVWARLAGKPRVTLYATLRTLPRSVLVQLQTKLPDAPAADAPKFSDVITDLLGSGTDMQAKDVIDLQGLSGLDRTMASIYNLRGQLIEEQASAMGVATDSAAAIMKVESGGATFSASTDKTIVRFENHVFWGEWGSAHAADFNAHFDFDRAAGGKRFKLHRFRAGARDPWEACHQNQDQEWRIIDFAAGLSGKEPAYRSTSWGAGQIMGSNAASVGYASAVDMAAAFNKAERPQVTGIFEFIRSHHLVAAVKARDFLKVASGYNGSGQKAAYAAMITAAADAYRRVTTGKAHVIP